MAEPEGSGQSFSKSPANGHDPEPVLSTFHPSALQVSSHISFVLSGLSQNSVSVLSLRTQQSYPRPIHYRYSNRRTVWPKPLYTYHHLLTSTYAPHMHKGWLTNGEKNMMHSTYITTACSYLRNTALTLPYTSWVLTVS